MPTPEFTGLGDNPTLSDVVDYVYKLEKELNYLLQNLDTSNVNRLDAKVVKTGTLDANLVTIRSDLSGTSYLQIDTNGIRANNGTINTFEIDSTGNAYFRGNVTSDATITGATIRTGVSGTNRIELSGGVFSGYTDTNARSGLYFTVLSNGLADLFLYHLGGQRLAFYDEVTYYTIKPGVDATQMGLGSSGTTTYLYGTVSMSSASDFLFTTATTATAGVNTLPANPVGFIQIPVNGTTQKIPYYDV